MSSDLSNIYAGVIHHALQNTGSYRIFRPSLPQLVSRLVSEISKIVKGKAYTNPETSSEIIGFNATVFDSHPNRAANTVMQNTNLSEITVSKYFMTNNYLNIVIIYVKQSVDFLKLKKMTSLSILIRLKML